MVITINITVWYCIMIVISFITNLMNKYQVVCYSIVTFNIDIQCQFIKLIFNIFKSVLYSTLFSVDRN